MDSNKWNRYFTILKNFCSIYEKNGFNFEIWNMYIDDYDNGFGSGT